ncbi:hypothetical protein [Kocuria sp. KH4]
MVLVLLIALVAAGVWYLVSLISVTASLDPWWRHLTRVERQIGRLEGIDRAILEIGTPVFHHRTLRGDWPPSTGVLHLELDENISLARLLELLPEIHQLITDHDRPVEHGHRIGPSDGSTRPGFPIDPSTWSVVVTSAEDRLETAEGPLSLLPDARLGTDDARAVTDRWETAPGYGTHRTSLVGYRGVDTNSVSSVEEFMAAREEVPDDVDVIGRDGKGLGIWTETRDDVGAYLIDPLPESMITLAADLHGQLTDRRIPHHIMIQDQAYVWPAHDAWLPSTAAGLNSRNHRFPEQEPLLQHGPVDLGRGRFHRWDHPDELTGCLSSAICEVAAARAFKVRAAGDTEGGDALIERTRQRATRALIDVAG